MSDHFLNVSPQKIEIIIFYELDVLGPANVSKSGEELLTKPSEQINFFMKGLHVLEQRKKLWRHSYNSRNIPLLVK